MTEWFRSCIRFAYLAIFMWWPTGTFGTVLTACLVTITYIDKCKALHITLSEGIAPLIRLSSIFR